MTGLIPAAPPAQEKTRIAACVFVGFAYTYQNTVRGCLGNRVMADKEKNTWLAKVKRTCTCVLPVSKTRAGQCVSCGQCCRLPNVCAFLRYGPDGKSYCTIYPIRPLSCRKYPRSESEFITSDTCGFRFE